MTNQYGENIQVFFNIKWHKKELKIENLMTLEIKVITTKTHLAM